MGISQLFIKAIDGWEPRSLAMNTSRRTEGFLATLILMAILGATIGGLYGEHRNALTYHKAEISTLKGEKEDLEILLETAELRVAHLQAELRHAKSVNEILAQVSKLHRHALTRTPERGSSSKQTRFTHD